jgi:2'-5' RNA ligase
LFFALRNVLCLFYFLLASGEDCGNPTEIDMDGAFEFYRDLPRRPKRPERLFFGAVADSATGRQLDEFRDWFVRDNDLKGARLKTERLHISFHHVGDYKRLLPKFVYAARQAGQAISIPSFEVTFRVVATFESMPRRDGRPPRWPLVLLGEGDGLFELHKILGAAMERYGLKIAGHFAPHMTLFYASRPMAPQAIKPIRFLVNEFALIHSELWLTRYNIVDRWRLKS